jgi:tetratricopeptide (TPR) repeat protein
VSIPLKFFSECENNDIPSKGTFCRWLHLSTIAVITLVIYFNALGAGFVADDNEFVKNNISIRNLKNIPSFFMSSESLASTVPEWGTHIYRPLRTVSYALDYAVYGLNSTGYHITSLLLHVLVCVSLYGLITAIFRNHTVAFLGALLFAVHPVHTEAVSWVAGRADLIGTLFLNLSLICYVYFREHSDRNIYLYLSLLLSVCAYLGKESMIVLPGFIILYDYVSHRERSLKRILSAHVFRWSGFMLTAACYLVLRFSVTGRIDQEVQWYGGSLFSQFLMMIKVTALYIWLLIFPFKLSTHYMIAPVDTFLNARVLLSLFVITVSMVLLIYFHRKSGKTFFLLAWFFFGLIPVANIVPTTFSLMGERYIYMASAGPIAAIAYGLFNLRNKSSLYNKIVWAILIAVVISWSGRVIMRNEVYKNELTFYSSAIASNPDSAPSYLGLADRYYKDRDYHNALINYKKALDRDPRYARAQMGEALVLSKSQKKDEALRKAGRAVALKPDDPILRFNMGVIYKDAGDIRSASEEWKKAVQLNPSYSEAYNNLGNYHMMMNNQAEALSMYKEALRSDPGNAVSHYNAAAIYERRGDAAAARHHYLLFVKFAGPEHEKTVEEVRRKYE